jgi:hypothetical protein
VTAADLRAMSRTELERIMTTAKPFDRALLAGATYRGISLGLPAWVDRLAWKKFAKCFAPDGKRGWNMRIEQDALDRPWRPMKRDGAPITFGPFAVTAEPDGVVVLDYSVGRGPLRGLRDPLVALDERADLLLGRSLYAIGGRTIGTPAYFSLERSSEAG